MAKPRSGSVRKARAPRATKSPTQAKERQRPLRTVAEIVIIVAAAFVIALLVQTFLLKPFTIPSASMEPTLKVGDRVLVNRLAYHFHSPHRGDVIVFHEPGQPAGATPLIKRVVAVAGDTVAVHDGYLYLNGTRQAEPFILGHPILTGFAPVTVSVGSLWVMGDNRNDSDDSRVFGVVSVKAVVGKAFALYWPLNHFKGL